MVVIDASIAVSWIIPDERKSFVNNLIKQLLKEGAAVPAIWPHEVVNALSMSLKRGRLNKHQFNKAMTLLKRVNVSVRGFNAQVDFEQTPELALKYDLTSYDASYLALAKNEALPFATLDRKLAKAAIDCGVEVLS